MTVIFGFDEKNDFDLDPNKKTLDVLLDTDLISIESIGGIQSPIHLVPGIGYTKEVFY